MFAIISISAYIRILNHRRFYTGRSAFIKNKKKRLYATFIIIMVWILTNSANVLAPYYGASTSHFDDCKVPLQLFLRDSVTIIFAFVIIIIIIIIMGHIVGPATW